MAETVRTTIVKGKGAKKSHKARKHGRNKRNGRNTRQAIRTAKNKLKRVNRERAKMGLKPLLALIPKWWT